MVGRELSRYKSKLTMRAVLLAAVAMFSCLCSAGTLTVTSPTSNSYISPNTNITFNISGATVQVTVKATTTFPDGSSTTSSQQVLPASDGTASGSIAANLGSSSPEGVYNIVVSASEPGGNYTPTNLSVTLLPKAPKFLSFSPPDGTFVNGTVHVRANILDDHLQGWSFQVNGQNVPNNTGTSNAVSVDWNTSGIAKDGPQTLTISATDLAGQTTTVTTNITICRVPPILTIQYPGTGTHILPHTDITVVVGIQGEFANSIDPTGVDVRVMSITGAYLMRVPLLSLTSAGSGSTTSLWTGRIRYVPNRLPNQFRLLISCVDKAGNAATPQSQIVKIGS